MNSIAIVGVGLIGGSFGLALRKAGFPGRILGVSSPRSLTGALHVGAIDASSTLEAAVEEAGVLYLAQPISGILSTLARLAAVDRDGLLITDAGSTKSRIVAQAARAVSRAQFLGGHPMAGKAARGVAAAEPDLFRDRPYVLTPRHLSDLNTPAASGFLEWVTRIGAVPIVMSPEEHDRTVAFTSHLPQLLSTALASCISQHLRLSDSVQVAGPGLRDTTRLALSSYDIWRDIIGTNVSNIEHALEVYIDKLTEIRENLQTQRLGVEFQTAAEMAHAIRRQGSVS
jgi:prephenate dehydrogenase